MLKLLPLLLLGGCVVSRPPSLSDTALKEEGRDWVQVYRMEIKIAVDNDDLGGYNFFFEEYMRLRIHQTRKEIK